MPLLRIRKEITMPAISRIIAGLIQILLIFG
jgi:hypothetical protein